MPIPQPIWGDYTRFFDEYILFCRGAGLLFNPALCKEERTQKFIRSRSLQCTSCPWYGTSYATLQCPV